MSSTCKDRHGFDMDYVEEDVYEAMQAARIMCRHFYETKDLRQYKMEVIGVARLLLEHRERVQERLRTGH